MKFGGEIGTESVKIRDDYMAENVKLLDVLITDNMIFYYFCFKYFQQQKKKKYYNKY